MRYKYRYYTYDPNGKCVFNSFRLDEAKLWLMDGGQIVRKHLLGEEPDKIYKK